MVIPVSDSDDELTFNPAEWIGIGKVYPHEDVSPEVQYGRKQIYTIPDDAQTCLPHVSMPITLFSTLILPSLSSAFITTNPDIWFSHRESTAEIDLLMQRPIPSKDFITSLDRSFGQAWFNGAKSVVDHRFNDGRDRYPLWVLRFWREMLRIVQVQLVVQHMAVHLFTFHQCDYQPDISDRNSYGGGSDAERL